MRKFPKAQGPWLLASAIALALLVAPFAVAAGEGSPLLGGKRNPGTNESRSFTSETEIIATTSSYGTRQSNKSDNGGGAIYGCRSKQGGTPKGNEPCVRSSNLADGRAFEFESKGGPEVGAIISSDPKAAPFTTNARGVATGLNADQVDGKSAEDIQKDTLAEGAKTFQAQTKFASVAGDGALSAGRGATAATRASAGVYTVDFNAAVNACAQTATSRGADLGIANIEQVDNDTLRVRTYDNTATAVDRPFHLVVNC